MLKIRYVFIALGMFFYSAAYADLQVNIGINVPIYPEMVVVPGYPVYYAPQLDSNYFFYDGLYWVFQEDNWYQSTWYNGPWWLVYPEDVPQFILRVPVSYYRRPPTFFFGWTSVSPPRWGEHWGRDWEQSRSGWDRWDHGAVNTPAPLPGYQRQYSGNRYPQKEEQQHELQNQNYRYQSRDPEVKPHARDQADPKAPSQQGKSQQSNSQQEQKAISDDNSARPQGRRPDQRSESPQRDNEEVRQPMPAPVQQDRPSVQEDRQKSNQQVSPTQQTSHKQQDHRTNQRSQYPQKPRVDSENSTPPSSQQRRSSAQSTRQQQRHESTQGEQQKQKTQAQKARQQRENTQTGPKQERDQEILKRRND
jgi:hypothetical protein